MLMFATILVYFFFFFNDTATTEIYTLSLHDALPICPTIFGPDKVPDSIFRSAAFCGSSFFGSSFLRSEEHTSELQSLAYLVCRLLLEKKKTLSRTIYLPLTNTSSYVVRT